MLELSSHLSPFVSELLVRESLACLQTTTKGRRGGREGGGGGQQLSYGLMRRMTTSKPLDAIHTSATIPGARSLVRRWGQILHIWK